MSSTLRTLGAGALGALLVAVAVLALRPGHRRRRPCHRHDPCPAHHHGVGERQGDDRPRCRPDHPRRTINKPTVKAVRDAGAKAMTDVIAAIKGLGVADADIQTTNLSLYPQYGNGSVQKIVGYQISEQVLVTVRDLDKAGDVVDVATAKGANAVNGISFESGDPVKAQDDARAAAVAAAKTSAQAMAAAGNVSLGGVVSITDASPTSPIWYADPARRCDERPRDTGPARDPGPDRDGHRGLRDQLARATVRPLCPSGRPRRRCRGAGSSRAPRARPTHRAGRAT